MLNVIPRGSEPIVVKVIVMDYELEAHQSRRCKEKLTELFR